MEVATPEIIWHGGGTNENGRPKPDPVFSVHMHENNLLITAGINDNMPPMGCVRLWKVDSANLSGFNTQNFIVELADHENVVNAAKFSPCGRMLASASDRRIIVYKAKSKEAWLNLENANALEKIWFNPSLTEIYDLQWSPDSSHIAAGAIDCKAEVIRISSRHSIPLKDHTSYVQGIAWDPFNKMIVTQSADRSCRVHHIKSTGAAGRIAIKGNSVIKMQMNLNEHQQDNENIAATHFPQNAKHQSEGPNATKLKAKNLFVDSSVPCFFRRPTFSPDGMYFIAPTGLFRPVGSVAPSQTMSSRKSFCTHIFSRNHMVYPMISLMGLEEPSVAVRCSPILYKLLPETEPQESMLNLKYRMIFAVLTTSAVYVYDTQHSHPIARLAGLHFACINDACWSYDGTLLTICSTDGYVSFAKFSAGSLGIPLEDNDVPIIVKQTYPAVYNYARPENLNEDTESLLDEGRLDMDADESAVAMLHDVRVQTDGNESGEHETATERIASMDVDIPADSSQYKDAHTLTVDNQHKKKRIAPLHVKAVSYSSSSSSSSSSSCTPTATVTATTTSSSSSSSSSSEPYIGNENQCPQSFATTTTKVFSEN